MTEPQKDASIHMWKNPLSEAEIGLLTCRSAGRELCVATPAVISQRLLQCVQHDHHVDGMPAASAICQAVPTACRAEASPSNLVPNLMASHETTLRAVQIVENGAVSNVDVCKDFDHV